jgi:hypothetical protein
MSKRVLSTDEEVQCLINLLQDDNDFFSRQLLTIHYNNEFKQENENSINFQSEKEFNSILH